MKWRVAAKLPGPQSWDKMHLVDQGLSPLTRSGDGVAMPEQATSNPFLRSAWLRAFAKAGVPAPEMKTSGMKFAAMPWKSLGTIWKSLRGSGAGTQTVQDMAKRFGKKGLDPNTPLGKLLQESAQGGTYNGMTHQIFPAIGRMAGGSYIGHQFDSADENATPWGTMIGAVAGLGSPLAVRKMLGNSQAAKGSIKRLFADRTISRRIANDPLNRVMLSAATGNMVDMGAGALGYDTGGWGERIGIAGGLAGGLRPLSQVLASRYKGVNTALNTMKKIPVVGQGFTKAQQGGFTYLPSYLLGSPYVVGGGGMLGMAGHTAFDMTLGERMRGLAEKKQMLTSAMKTPEMEPIKKMMEQTLHQIYGPQAKFYDPDGMPSKEAIHLIQQLGQYGMMRLQDAGHNFFGDSNYMFDPRNWQRLSSPMSAMGDFVRGQATRMNPLPF